MSDFVVSARKYRPATFDTVVGQSGITTTLKNAIKNHHLAQAFLFCGPRGVGKTTCARILAKTINCTNISEQVEACDQCDSCKSFNEGQSLNIYELDAASNNSVDDIRALIEQVRFAPQLGQYKVYIIDEVHMLSASAFNAFLKTLEEPPKHAIFILATTEKHKILPTILSRCQIFDFKRIRIEDIANHLAFIAKNESIQAENEALHIIAQKADGALRDACSIFDQLVSFAGNHLTYKAVIENLNILDYDYYFKVTDFIIKKDIPSTLLTLNEIIHKGFDGHLFITGLAEHFRNLLVSKDENTIQLLEVSNAVANKYKEQSKQLDQNTLLLALTICNKVDIGYKASKNPRLQVELALMQLCSLNTSYQEAEKKNDFNVPIIIGNPLNIPEKVLQEIESTVTSTSNTIIEKQTVAATTTSSTTKKIISKSSGLSLKELINQSKNPTSGNTNSIESFTKQIVAPATSVNENSLQEKWSNYALMLKSKNKINLATTLLADKPLLKDNTIIQFNITNKVQEEEIIQEKLELLAYLKKELNNFHLTLETIINKSENGKQAYTTSDKFKLMIQKNPELNKLKQLFDLDTDY